LLLARLTLAILFAASPQAPARRQNALFSTRLGHSAVRVAAPRSSCSMRSQCARE
jgi:hypothetical protein